MGIHWRHKWSIWHDSRTSIHDGWSGAFLYTKATQTRWCEICKKKKFRNI